VLRGRRLHIEMGTASATRHHSKEFNNIIKSSPEEGRGEEKGRNYSPRAHDGMRGSHADIPHRHMWIRGCTRSVQYGEIASVLIEYGPRVSA
jgi:hypothetical protein